MEPGLRHPQTTDRNILIRASLLGLAIGDSLGADIEFLPLEEVHRRVPAGFGDLPVHDGVRGAVTDDTQMTLFTAEGILQARNRFEARGLANVTEMVHRALIRWAITQGEDVGDGLAVDRTGLVLDERLHARRAPGLTCLSALRATRAYATPTANDSKGCGTIMRVAPVAWYINRNGIRDTAIETSALTHGHSTGQLSAAAWAELLADVMAGASVDGAAARLADEYAAIEHGEETADAIRRTLSAQRDATPETVEALGTGWTADEALSVALYACLCARSFEHGATIAVTHGGDSDSTGAIAGSLLGVMFPDQTLGHRWASQVECADLIGSFAAPRRD